MATTPAERTVYPFSTRDSDSVPLEIIDPLSLIRLDIPGLGSVTAVLPEGFELGHVFSPSGCIIEFGNTIPSLLVAGTVYANTLLVPPGTLVTVKFTTGTIKVIPLQGEATYVYLQAVIKWNTLGLKQQVKVK